MDCGGRCAAPVRRTPYTQIGIRRIACTRCGAKPGVHQWQTCADGNVWRVVCARCDVALNRLVLRWMRFTDWRELSNRYAART